ncbi:MAG: Ig-like domain-containing protein [Desulfurivibrio sp.]
MADEKEKNDFGDIDDWLADLDDDSKGGSEAVAPAALDAGGELDQSDIDQLLGGAGNDDQPAAAGGESAELEQSDIDSLFNEAPRSATEEQEGAEIAAAEDDFVGLDQSDLDDLLGEGDEPPAAEPAPVVSAEAEAGTREDFAAPEATPMAAAPQPSSPENKDEFGFDGDDFDIDGFDFNDSIPDIPDESILTAAKGQEQFADSSDIFADLPEEGAAGDAGDQFASEDEKERQPFLAFLPLSLASLSASRKSTIGAGLLSLLLLIGGFYYFLGRQPVGEQAITSQVREQMVQVLEPEPVDPMIPPTARDDRYRMEEDGAVSMQLIGRSPDGGPLAYEILTPPRYGRLSGEPPMVTYLPNQDFPGEDSFVYRVSDGLLVSDPARVEIFGSGAQMEAEAPAEPTEVVEVFHLTPEYPLVRARDLTLQILSTEPLLIDWAEIWRRDNAAPFSPRVQVEILARRMPSGNLVALGPAAHRYEPDPYFAGEESLSFRFNHAGVRSKPRQLTLQVTAGNPPPSLRLRPLAANYPAGETVLLDAGGTLALRPSELRFVWQQLSGTEVLLESLADNNAVVRFVAPSDFSILDTPKVVLQVTAIDPGGRRDSQIVEILTPSRRQSALWPRGGVGGAGL